MPRLIGPLEFALALGMIGAIGLAFSTQFGRPLRYVRALAALVAIPVAAWSASLARQIVVELRADGVVPWQSDSCSIFVMPILVVVLAFVLVALAEVYALLGVLQDVRRPREPLSIRMTFSRNEIVAIAVMTALGGLFGLTQWVDWRINQPCL